jgi:hypothetical protein
MKQAISKLAAIPPKIARKCGCGASTVRPSCLEETVRSTVRTKAMEIQVPVSGLMTPAINAAPVGRRGRTPRTKNPLDLSTVREANDRTVSQTGPGFLTCVPDRCAKI